MGERWRQQLQPDLAVVVDESLCIVLECGIGENKKLVTLSDCDAVAEAMKLARINVQVLAEEDWNSRRLADMAEARVKRAR